MDQATGRNYRVWRERVPIAIAAVTLIVATTVLVAWHAGLMWIVQPLPGRPAMSPNTSVALLLLGLSLLIHSLARGSQSSRLRAVALTVELLVAGLALLTLVQYLFSVDLGIDASWAPPGLSEQGASIRPSPRTAIELLLLSLSMLLGARRAQHAQRAAEVLALLALPLPALALVGYVYALQPLYGVTQATGMAITTALLCMLMAVGALCRLQRSLALQALSGTSPGGTLARRLLPAVVIAPIAFGWLQLQGETAGLFDSARGIPAFVIANIILLSALVWLTSKHLDRLHDLYLQSQQEYRALAESANDAIVTYDEAQRITYCNRAAELMFGITRAEARGRPITRYLDLRNTAQAVPVSDDWSPHESPRSTETVGMRDSGNSFPVEVSSASWYGGAWAYTTVIVRDITERKQAEAALAQRTQELELTNHELSAFAYTASHDLRAPIRSIDGFLTLALEESGEQLSAQARSYLERIREAIVTMRSLIDGLLGLARLSTLELEEREVDLGEVARGIIADLRAAERHRNVELTVSGELKLEGDPRLLRSLMQNLLGNAWKFTASRPQAHIEVGSERSEGSVTYYVRDDGIGFDPALAERLFEPFQRLHTEREYRGSGIGLATAKRIVQRYGGEIWAQSEPNVYAVFFFRLESAVPAARAGTAPTHDVRASA